MTTASRYRLFNDAQWELISELLPSNQGRRGHPFGDDRRVVEGIIYRYRTGIPWRDLPRSEFGPWQTVWKRHRRYAGDGTWDRVLMVLLAMADADGRLDWTVSVDATINRAHQHATNTTRPDQDTGAGSNYTNLPLHDCEPAGHGSGRSRGGLTTKIHSHHGAARGTEIPMLVGQTTLRHRLRLSVLAALDQRIAARRSLPAAKTSIVYEKSARIAVTESGHHRVTDRAPSRSRGRRHHTVEGSP